MRLLRCVDDIQEQILNLWPVLSILRMDHSRSGKGESQNRNIVFLAELLCGFRNLLGIVRCGEELGNARESEELACGVARLKQTVGVEREAIAAAHTHL